MEKGCAADEFLRHHGMHFEGMDPEKELEKLLRAMEDDYRQGGKTGRMIPAYVGTYQAPKQASDVTVIDIGGTNVRSAVVTIGPAGICRIRNLQFHLTPGVEEETDTAGFYGKVVADVRENLVTDEIGICFSLATIPQKDRDAVMVAGGKQIRIRDMLGKKVGESFRRAMAAHGLRTDARITVVNDTVAAAPGGQAATERQAGFGGYMGFIYGTGINLCYREPTGEWINTETAVYDTFPAGDLDEAFDAGLIDPGQDRLEKMVSGRYQGGLMTCILRSAAGEGIIGPETAARLFSRDLTAKDISAFANDPAGNNLLANACANEADREVIATICDAITERSALICSVVLTAGLLRGGAGHDPARPVFITAEGSTFLKQKDFRAKLEKRLEALATRRHGVFFEMHVVPDVILRGIAVACLS